MVTLRTPKAWPRYAARWFREQVHAPFMCVVSAGAVKRPRVTSASAGLSALIVLTTLAVAWVSVWWVPAYLGLMVLIFVTPHSRGRAESRAESNRESCAAILVDLGGGLRVDDANEVGHSHFDTGSAAGPLDRASTLETETPDLGLTSSGTTKGRRTRGRARKSVKTASERAPESAAVMWIRVGPGKFVRAEGGSEPVFEAQDGKVSVDEHAVQDGSIGELPTLSAPDYTLVVEDHSTEPAVDNDGDPISSGGFNNDSVVGSVAGVYGIAPSTFGSVPLDSRPVEGLDSHVPTPGITLDADCSHARELSDELPAHGESWQKVRPVDRLTGSRIYRFSRRIANTIRRADRASLRCDVRKGPKARVVVRRSVGLNGRCIGQVIGRAFGRISHHQRVLRPRSPPYS